MITQQRPWWIVDIINHHDAIVMFQCIGNKRNGGCLTKGLGASKKYKKTTIFTGVLHISCDISCIAFDNA
ncbi:hypothetical protein AD954_01920 [Acetobacter cerevisiae]|uniref:Uncharacterized protein n=1 Tax=Acetobacter cerevisiae TaxID=178900 RepID=A0A149VES6_9PROT|nr:hypothetical protein AD954_01920 [Acetobacter cerevisiae]